MLTLALVPRRYVDVGSIGSVFLSSLLKCIRSRQALPTIRISVVDLIELVDEVHSLGIGSRNTNQQAMLNPDAKYLL